ncbi:unnamed protein product, partial [Larinioides sclopetarius]
LIKLWISIRNYKIEIGNIAEVSLPVYSDVLNFASCRDDRISVDGHIFLYGNAQDFVMNC